jgi:hypothetical protein
MSRNSASKVFLSTRLDVANLNTADPEDIILGPPKTSFMSATSIRNLHAMLTLAIGIVSGARLAKVTLKRHEKAGPTRYVQSALRIRIVMGGALSSPERALVLKVLSDLMAAWESTDIEMTGDSRTEKTAI